MEKYFKAISLKSQQKLNNKLKSVKVSFADLELHAVNNFSQYLALEILFAIIKQWGMLVKNKTKNSLSVCYCTGIFRSKNCLFLLQIAASY